MKKLIFAGQTFHALSDTMLRSAEETCAVLIAEECYGRIVVQDTYTAPRSAYRRRDRFSAILDPTFFIPIVASARKSGRSIVFAHTHPADSDSPTFSVIDDAGEEELASFLRRRIPDHSHVAMVISPGGCAARELGSSIDVQVLSVAAVVREETSPGFQPHDAGVWNRQVLAFGIAGQTTLRELKVAVVGCGGTGSVVCQELAHLGVRDFVLIDPDVIEATNLNRLVGARYADIGRPKVDVAANLIREAGVGAVVEAMQDDVRTEGCVDALRQCDAIVSCTDSHSSRAIINQVAYQYVVPAFDVGVSIDAVDGLVRHVTGRAQMLAPGLACLVCGGALDAAAIRRELLDERGRQQDPYFIGNGVSQPAVISINSTMASLLVTMLIGAFTNAPLHARLQYYDAVSGRVRNATQRPDPTCIVCSPSGSLGKGAKWPITGLAR